MLIGRGPRIIAQKGTPPVAPTARAKGDQFTSSDLYIDTYEGFNDWGGRGYDDFVPGEVTKTTPSGDETS